MSETGTHAEFWSIVEMELAELCLSVDEAKQLARFFAEIGWQDERPNR